MVLFYCTVCALYPCLYATSLSISPASENETDTNKDELESTSEGLCDFLREIFFLNRQTFNDYQIKALKKLLLRKSQAQVWMQKKTDFYLRHASLLNNTLGFERRNTQTTIYCHK
jgi:hypothetical protein